MVRTILRPKGMLLQNAWDRSNTLGEAEHDEVARDFSQLTADYRRVFAQYEDLHVPMPPEIDIVHVLKGTNEDAAGTLHPPDQKTGTEKKIHPVPLVNQSVAFSQLPT